MEFSPALTTTISKSVRQARASRGLTQQDVAEKLGISVEFYGRIERGTRSPGLDTAVRMAVVLGVSLDKLVGLDDTAEAPELVARYAQQADHDPPEHRRLFRQLRAMPVPKLRVVTTLLNSMNRCLDELERTQSIEAAPDAEAAANAASDAESADADSSCDW